ncbi:MAG: transglutaminase family protein [Ferruginibacter sp.]
MKRLSTLLLLMVMSFCSHAQLTIYSALTIPDSLKKDADIVIREEQVKLVIKDKNTGWLNVHKVFTVMNEEAKGWLYFQQYSDRFRMLDDAEIKMYDMLGNKKNSWTKREMNTGKDKEDLVPDVKYTYFTVNAGSYPITVEFNYTIRYKGIFNLPDYYLQFSRQSIQHALFEIEVPADLGVRYKLLNTNKNPVITKSGNKETYVWEQKDLTAFKIEKHSGSPDKYLPQVMLAPNKFQLDEYDGDMTSWKNFGIWMNDLYAKVSSLPEDKKQFYRNLVKNAVTDNEKAAILYNYLQNNMRYVSIQLGIGGWRPFSASFVDEKKYGDCKALSNYLKSTLDAVGIKANIIIIYRDYEAREVDEKFPVNDFNHAILCIPQPADTVWLECTSTTLPFASLDETTLSRKAVMITDAGGVLVNTPSSNYKTNSESVKTIIEVNEDGGAKAQMAYTLYGEVRDKMLMRFHDMKEDEKKRFVINNMDLKQPDELEINNSKNKSNPYVVNVKMNYEKIYSFNAGSKLFFESRLYNMFDEDIPEYEKRIRDYYFTFPYQVMDTTLYRFPAGYSLETMPKNRSVQYPFAAYSSKYSWDASAHTLTSITVLQVKERVVKAADYPRLLDFKKQVMADVNEKIVMKKQ